MKKLAYISGAVCGSLTTLAVLFKILHWMGASLLLVLGLGGLALVFIPAYALYRYKK